MAKSLKVDPLTPFRKCKNCKSVCGPGVSRCPVCSCLNFDTLTVEELKATADPDGKIKAFATEIPDWPKGKGAWQIVDTEKERKLETPL